MDTVFECDRGMVAVVVVEASDAGASDLEMVGISLFCFSNVALESAIMFCTPSGKGSDCDSAQ